MVAHDVGHVPVRAAASAALPERAAAALTALRRGRHPYQPFLYGVGALLLVAGLLHAVVWAATGDSWTDPVSWRKPALFGISFGLTALSLAWIHTFLRPRPLLGWATCGSFGLAALGEVGLISMQRSRGVASHFNTVSAFDARVFVAMGLLVGIVALGIVVVTVRSLGRLAVAPEMALAIRAGLLLLVAGQVFGGLILGNAGQELAAHPGALEAASVFGAAGQMKVPHAVALHAVQVLPALAWLAALTGLSARGRGRLVVAATAGYTGLLAVTALQTFRGLAPAQLDATAGVVLIVGLGLLGVAAAVLVMHLVPLTSRHGRARAGAAVPDTGPPQVTSS